MIICCMAGKYFNKYYCMCISMASHSICCVRSTDTENYSVCCTTEGICGSTMAKTVQFYIGVSYQFFAVISGPTDIVKISISATNTICISISVHP